MYLRWIFTDISKRKAWHHGLNSNIVNSNQNKIWHKFVLIFTINDEPFNDKVAVVFFLKRDHLRAASIQFIPVEPSLQLIHTCCTTQSQYCGRKIEQNSRPLQGHHSHLIAGSMGGGGCTTPSPCSNDYPGTIYAFFSDSTTSLLHMDGTKQRWKQHIYRPESSPLSPQGLMRAYTRSLTHCAFIVNC